MRYCYSFVAAILLVPALASVEAGDNELPIPIGGRLELMVGRHLVESFTGDARLELHHPTIQDIALNHDAAWEGSGSNFHTVFRDGDLYRMYYRGAQFTTTGGKLKEDHPQFTCYAESRDGIHWEKPKLGLFEFNGSKENNIIWASGRATHNFAPFKDSRPGVPKDERYKALAYAAKGRGLGVLASADGIRWRWLSEEPVITKGRFDSQNIAFWDTARNEYRAYYRDFRDGFRDIRTASSKDFSTWTEGEWVDYGDSPRQHIYTNQISPYYRAPHVLIGLPTRYQDHGKLEWMMKLPEAKHRKLRSAASNRYGTALTDTLLMSSHDRRTFSRWNEAFIPPGLERPGTWNYGQLFTAAGLVETKPRSEGLPNELSIYATEGGWTGKDTQLRRYTLRIDGFASVYASVPGGEMRTKLLTFQGKELVLNFASSAGGFMRVAIHDVNDKPIKGFDLDDCIPLFGDTLERTVKWTAGSDVSQLAGQAVRLRIVLKDTHLYSFRFR